MAEAIPARFEREHGCTEAEWLRSLPGAVGRHDLALDPARPGHATVRLQGGGELELDWHVLPERRIALIRLPRLQVRYAFDDAVPDSARSAFMHLFDLHTRRGGG